MDSKVFFIVGLGNPGNIYEKTRHNAGFMAVDFISNNHNFSWNHKSKFNADIANGLIGENKVILCKPCTFMNLSGNSVAQLVSYYKINISNLIVIHDDLDLPLSKLKCKIGGSSGGHNGLKSIDSHLGPNYLRIRIGVGRPDSIKINIADYVISNFLEQELTILQQKYRLIEENINLLFERKIDEFKTRISC